MQKTVHEIRHARYENLFDDPSSVLISVLLFYNYLLLRT
jgi:hypothetical protein